MTFEYLNQNNPYFKGADIYVYNRLINLHFVNNDEECELLLTKINQLNYYSNCDAVFEFYLPIVAHILYFRPEEVDKMLYLIIGPLFALGIDKEDAIVQYIITTACDKLKAESDFLTTYGFQWIEKLLPQHTEEIRKQLKRCREELES